MRTEMANQLPPPGVKRRHGHRGHLARIDGESGGKGPGGVDKVVAVQVEDVRVEAHVVDVPDYGIVEAHAEGGCVGVDVAIYLFIRVSMVVRANMFEERS